MTTLVNKTTDMTESETTRTPARLGLNPGRTRQRTERSRRRCLLFTLAAVLAAGWICYYVGVFVLRILSLLLAPHQNVYASTNITFPSPLVVRPLINTNDTFDIAVTVWARATAEEEERYRLCNAELANTTVNPNLDLELVAEEAKRRTSGFTMELLKDDYILETPLYSDIAFRGLHLSTKDVSTLVKFRLPTARLYVPSIVRSQCYPLIPELLLAEVLISHGTIYVHLSS